MILFYRTHKLRRRRIPKAGSGFHTARFHPCRGGVGLNRPGSDRLQVYLKFSTMKTMPAARRLRRPLSPLSAEFGGTLSGPNPRPLVHSPLPTSSPPPASPSSSGVSSVRRLFSGVGTFGSCWTNGRQASFFSAPGPLCHRSPKACSMGEGWATRFYCPVWPQDPTKERPCLESRRNLPPPSLCSSLPLPAFDCGYFDSGSRDAHRPSFCL